MTASFHQPRLVEFQLPDWIETLVADPPLYPSPEQRMALVIEASRRNAEQGCGPFAAAVFERDSGRLISLGVNRVISQGLSILHAEVVAICLAQRQLGGYDLGGEGLSHHQLVTSTEPCAMCLGAICWSGLRSLVTAAREADAEAVGFDEGPKPADWVAELEQRGISVQRDLLREEAAAVLRHYQRSGGQVYNARAG